MARTDTHRPSAIDPAAYAYRWAFDAADENNAETRGA